MPWVRVRDHEGNEFDRQHDDEGIGEQYQLVKGYPENTSPYPRPHKYPVDLKGAALDEALDQAGLPKTGSAADKRDRLAEHEAQTTGAVPVDPTSTGD